MENPKINPADEYYEPQSRPDYSDVGTIENEFASYLDKPRNNLFLAAGSGAPQILCMPQQKRGDYHYVRKVEERVETWNNHLQKVKFFDADAALKYYAELEAAHRTNLYDVKTYMLYIVGTYDRKKTSLEDSWKLHGSQVNLFVSRSKKLLKCSVKRFQIPEAHKSGYCHVNVVILLDKPVKIYPHKKIIRDKDGNVKETKITWRIKNSVLWHNLKACWPHGFSDIQAVACIEYGSTSEHHAAVKNGTLSLKYLMKYLLKAVDGLEARLKYPLSFRQYSMLWWHGCRAYSLPQKFNVTLEKIVATNGLDLIKIKRICITKTAKSVKPRKLVYIRSIYYNPRQNPDVYDRWRTMWLQENFIFADSSSHIAKYRSVYDYLAQREKEKNKSSQVFSTSPAARLVKTRTLTYQQARDVWNGTNPHSEIPLVHEWR